MFGMQHTTSYTSNYTITTIIIANINILNIDNKYVSWAKCSVVRYLINR